MKASLLATASLAALIAGAAPVIAQTATTPAAATPAPVPTPPPAQTSVGFQSPFDLNVAPVGKAAGTVMVRVRAIGVLPQNLGSSVSPIGGQVSATNQAAPEVDVSYFFTDNIAAELIAASTRHDVSAVNTIVGKVDVGSVWVLPPTLTFQYHFVPHSRFSPYIGAGLNLTFFYDSQPSLPTVTKVGYSTNVGAAIQAGFDYNITGHWFANFDVKQIFLQTTARINGGTIIAHTGLDPTVIGAGIGYRF